MIMVKCEAIKCEVEKLVRPIYTETVDGIVKEHHGHVKRATVIKRVGTVDDIISEICIAIEMTTEHMGNPGIWLDEYGRLKRNMVVETIQERYETYEKRLEAEWEFDVDARCNMPKGE